MNFKLTDRTKELITNFSAINPSMLFLPGQALRTVSSSKAIYGTAKIKEKFTKKFGIYDLSRLLSLISLRKNPVLEFSDDSVTIKEEENNRKRYKYRYTDEIMILSPEYDIELPEDKIIMNFELTAEDLAELNRTIAISKHPNVAFVAKDGELSLQERIPMRLSAMSMKISFQILTRSSSSCLRQQSSRSCCRASIR